MAELGRAPTEREVAFLRANPQHAKGFDAAFGAGAAARAIGQQPDIQPDTTEASTTETPEAPEASGSIVGDMARGAVSGVTEAVHQGLNTIDKLDETVASGLEAVGLPGRPFTTKTTEELQAEGAVNPLTGSAVGVTGDAYDPAIVRKPVSLAGGATQGIVQFLTGFAITRRAGVSNPFVAGAVADAGFFDPYEGNLSSFMKDNGWAIPVVTELLAVDPEDPEWMARGKMALEGLAMGAVVEGALKGIRAVALRRKAAGAAPEEAARLTDEADQLAEEVAEEGEDLTENGVPEDLQPPETQPEATVQQPMGQPQQTEAPTAPPAFDALVSLTPELRDRMGIPDQPDGIKYLATSSAHFDELGLSDAEIDRLAKAHRALLAAEGIDHKQLMEWLEPQREGLKRSFLAEYTDEPEGGVISLARRLVRKNLFGRYGSLNKAAEAFAETELQAAPLFMEALDDMAMREEVASVISAASERDPRLRNVWIAEQDATGRIDEGERHFVEWAAQEAIARDLIRSVGLASNTNAAPATQRAIDPAAMKEASQVASEIVDPSKPTKVSRFIDTARLKLAVDARGHHAMPELDALVEEGGWFNYGKMDGPVEPMQLMETMGAALDEAGLLKAYNLDKPEALATTLAKSKAELADMVGIGADKFQQRLQKLAEAGVNAPRTIVTGKVVLQSLGREITQLAGRIDNLTQAGKTDTALNEQLIRLMEMHANTQLHLKAAQTSAARATSAGRIRTTDGLDAEALEKMMAAGGDERIKKLAKQLRASSGPNQTARLIRRTVKHGAADVALEYWVNSILSGYKTQMVNVASSVINSAVLPLERVLGGALSMNPRQMAEGLEQYAQYRHHVMDSLRLAGRAFVDEDSILDVSQKVEVIGVRGRKAITSETAGLDPNSVGGQAVDWAGKFLRLPSRALLTSDEFFKQMNFRARLAAKLSVEAKGMTPEELARYGYQSAGEFVHGEFEKAFAKAEDLAAEFDKMVEQGRVQPDPSLREQFIHEHLGSVRLGSRGAEDALRNAREATFTTPLRPGTFLHGYQKLAGQFPAMRFITPFIQTPTNILRAAVERTPLLQLASRQLREGLRSPDASIRAESRGKLATSVMIYSAASMLTLEGRLTGGGPADPNKRKLWMEAGWQPYSVNVGTAEKPNWIQYRRLDPWGFAFGIVADVTEMSQMADSDPSFDGGSLAGMAMLSFANNVTDKTWLKGISDVLEVLNAGEQAHIVDRWVVNQGASFIPYSSLGRQANQALDPSMRDPGRASMMEVETWVNAAKQRVPGYSETLTARHSWLDGQPIDTPDHAFGFLQQKREKADPVLTELRRLNYGFTGPARKIGEIELSPEAHQEWNMLTGSIKPRRFGGRTLKESLLREMEKDRYDLKRERVPDGLVAPDESHRVKALREVIADYKDEALKELLDRHPDLEREVVRWERLKTQASRGKAPEDSRENLLLKY